MHYKHGTPKSKLNVGRRPLQPVVTMDEIVAFDPARPETATASPLMNQILSAMHAVCPLSSTTLGRYLGIDAKSVCVAVRLLTGIPYPEMRETWAKRRVAILAKQHPDWTKDRLARAVGYASHLGLWRTEHREKRRQEYRELRQYIAEREAQRRREWEAEQARMMAEEQPPIGTNLHESPSGAPSL